MHFRNYLSILSLLALLLLSAQSRTEEGEPELVQYIEMRPSFVLNYGPPSPKLSYAKVDISLRVNSKAGITAVEHHMPALRNTIVLMFSQQTEEIMGNSQGREKLRLEALKALQELLEEEEGKPMIEDLLFTSFVVQK
ncbi:flagellar basal body-associated FliL family protein [Hahella ganghwensis]|uniref:flagellar basal body-associated FliL family protein n=1 Tax=Hahella ganghwensis TaxID=286420 RepID=UPI00036F4C13|nr:flagellar basal body-associated FliL family protein [Hahella ganghwensis]